MIAEDINTVLAAYEDAEAGGGTRLSEWIDRYPQYEAELTRYAVYSYVVAHGRALTDEAAEESRFREVAKRAREQMMAAQGVAPAVPGGRMISLIDSATERGISAADLARSVGLSPLEIVKLNQRLFRAAGIPRLLVARLADSLGRTMDEIASYLRQPPTLARQAEYRAAEAPKLAAQEEFGAAIASSRGLDADQKAFWAEAAQDTLGEE